MIDKRTTTTSHEDAEAELNVSLILLNIKLVINY